MENKIEPVVNEKFNALLPILDEKGRLWAAAEAKSLGRGGISAVSKATDLSRTTIYQGLKEIEPSNVAKPATT